MNEDADHLRQYAEDRSQDAFALVVQKYLPLVYRAALRRVHGDVHRAEDVTQLTFIALARHAAELVRHPDLTGWLFITTRFVAANSLRTDQRRAAREREAGLMQETFAATPPSEGSATLQDVLDDVLLELKELDRQVLLLRFHRGLRLAEIGRQLDVSENAAQKRLDRALDALRTRLARRGVTSTAAALALAFEAQATVAVPAGLVASALGAAIACGTATTASAGLTGLMALSKLQVGIAVTVLLAGASGLVWIQQDNTRLRTELKRQAAATLTESSALRRELVAATVNARTSAEALSVPASTAGPAAPAPKTILQIGEEAFAYTTAVRQRGRQLQEEGRAQEAMELYLETYHDFRLMRSSTGEIDPIGSREIQIMMGALARLGETFLPALEALRQLRENAEREVTDTPDLRSPVQEVSSLNAHLKDAARNIALFESLPSGDVRRQIVGARAYEDLVKARRYDDALRARSFSSMMHSVESVPQKTSTQSADSYRADLSVLLRETPRDIEVLTATGRHEEARLLAARLLEIRGNSEATRALIEQHIARGAQGTNR